MKILVDADACPVTEIIERIAKKYGIEVILLCDTNHILHSDYCEVKIVSAGADAVDFALINMCNKGDVVVTQDYGVAAMALGKQAITFNPGGKEYTDDNIDELLMRRHLAKKERRKGVSIKGVAKRTEKDNQRFEQEFEKVIRNLVVKS